MKYSPTEMKLYESEIWKYKKNNPKMQRLISFVTNESKDDDEINII